MIISMTGYASAMGSGDGWRWSWDLKSVNGRGLDIRLRVPDWIDGLETALRPLAQKAVARGNVTLSLRVFRESGLAEMGMEDAGIARGLAQVARLETAAAAAGLVLAPSRATDILGLKALAETAQPDTTALKTRLVSQFQSEVLPEFLAMRRSEGAAIAQMLTGQLDRIANLVEQATRAADARGDKMAETLRAALERITKDTDIVDPDRLAQELALLALKGDITEELDRLRAHVTAARDLLDHDGPVGRKLDFLSQEFNREANTLCSKSQDVALTQTGLDLKTVIDQMREQVQNVE